MPEFSAPKMRLEVPVDSLTSASAAVYSLCDELEVCMALPLGGLTPSVGLVTEVIALVDNFMSHSAPWKIERPKVNVMIRCKTGNDFCYDEMEMRVMLADVEHFKTMQIDRFVFGCLDTDGDIDHMLCQQFITCANPIPVTFHRAFDQGSTHHLLVASDLARLGFSRILTSGRQQSVSNPNAYAVIRDLVRSCGNDIEIMPGGGLTGNCIPNFKELGCKIVHSSCKIVKKMPVPDIDCGLGDDDKCVEYVTEGKSVRRMIKLMNVEKKRLLLDDTVRSSFDLGDGDDSE